MTSEHHDVLAGPAGGGTQRREEQGTGRVADPVITPGRGSRRSEPLARWWLGVIAYLAVGLLWILVTDRWMFARAEELAWWSTAKGVLYVLLTAGVLGAVLARFRRRIVATEAALSAREAELALLGTHVDDLLYRVELGPPPRLAVVGEVAERLLGHTAASLCADPDLGLSLLHPDDRARLRSDPAAIPVSRRLRWQHRDGRSRWFDHHLGLQHRDGRPAGLIGVARDVTGEVLSVGLRDALDRLRAEVLVEHLGFAVGLDRLTGRLAELWEAVEVTIAFDPTPPLCRGHHVVAADAGPRDPVASEAADADPGSELVHEFGGLAVTVRPSTRTPSVEQVAAALARLAVEVTAIHEAEHRDLELQRLRQALEATASAVLLTDDQGLIEWVNAAFTTITGYRPEEAIGRTPRILRSGQQDPAYYAVMWRTIRSGRPFADQLVDRRRDGGHYTAAVTIDPVFDRDGRITGFVGVQKDVTAEEALRTRMHQREVEALATARNIEQDRSLLVQTISHELRTPLTVVLGVAETLQRSELPPVEREPLMAALRRAIDQVLGRLEVLLAATDGVEGPPAATTTDALLDAALARTGRHAERGRVVVLGSGSWFGQVALATAMLRPLLDNALEYSPADTEVEVTVDRTAEGLQLVIRDRGPGIDPSFLHRVEQPFAQQDGSRTREHGGMGLGLYAARRAAQRLHATMELRSGDDGTVVSVTLPDDTGVLGLDRSSSVASPPAASEEVR